MCLKFYNIIVNNSYIFSYYLHIYDYSIFKLNCCLKYLACPNSERQFI